MLTLREDAEGHLVVQNVNCLLDGLLILLNLVKAVTNTHNRHNLQELEDFSQYRFAEYVGTCHKDLGTAIHSKDYQRIHQGVSMVGGIYYGSILRDTLTTYIVYIAIGKFEHAIYIVAQNVVC